MEDLLTCDECGASLPALVDGSTQCPRCGTEHLARTGEILAAIEPTTERNLPLDRPSHAGEDAARIPMTEEAIMDLLHRYFGSLGSVLFAPHIPEKKESSARRAHIVHLPDPERVLALYDGSMFGNTDGGFIITARRLCWRNKNDTACTILWRDIDPDRLFLDGRRLYIDDDALVIPDEDVIESCMDAFHVLALSARPVSSGHMPVAAVSAAAPKLETASARPPEYGSGPSAWFLDAAEPLSVRVQTASGAATLGTPPPPHTASYLGYASKAEKAPPACKCWHCYTPLHASTPQCGYCGAVPKKAGWRKAS